MPLFKRSPGRPPSAQLEPPRAPVDLNQALEVILVKSVESQANLASKISDMVIGQMEAMTTIVAKRMGSKGGKKSAANRARRANGTFYPRRMSDCRLCFDPSIPDPTAAEIKAHMDHHRALPPPPPDVQQVQGYLVEGDAVRVDIPESHVQAAPDGSEVVECPDCARGVPHEHGVQ